MRNYLSAPMIGAVLLAGPALAAPPGDCPPLHPLTGYETLDAPHRLPYDGVSFTPAGGKPETEAGHVCRQTYHPHSVGERMGDADIIKGYRSALETLGAKLGASTDHTVDATLDSGGKQLRLKADSQGGEIAVTVLEVAPHVQVLTKPSGHDFHLLGHLSGYIPDPPDHQNQASLNLTLAEGKTVTVEGTLTKIHYTWIDGQVERSSLDIETNYRNALKAAGAEILATQPSGTIAKLDDRGKTVWIQITDEGTAVDVSILDEAPGRHS